VTRQSPEDLDTSINKAIHDLNPSDLPASLPHKSDQSLCAEVIRVQVQALEAANEVSSSTTPSCELLHTPSTPESPYESASESIHKSTYSYSLTIVASRFPDFKMCGTFDSESNAARWHDSERAGHSPPLPHMYLRAIDTLLEGKAAIYLDSNPRVRALVDLGTDATADAIHELNDA
jgi:hypothetical protein